MDQLDEALARTRQADLVAATRAPPRPSASVPGAARRSRRWRRRRADEL